MSRCSKDQSFLPLNITLLTVSDSRSAKEDTSGDLLADLLQSAGHILIDRTLLPDDLYKIRAQVAHWIAQEGVEIVLITGGTGPTGRDRTPEAVRPLLDKEMDGFGELFRWLSYQDIGTATVQSRALAGVANGTLVVALPGSPKACRLAWEGILVEQLDRRQGPCNFVTLIPRLRE